jgi:hypothetical protein
MGGYGAMGDYAVGAGDARAAATQASGNAWGQMGANLGNTIGGLALYGANQPKTPYSPTTLTTRTPSYTAQLPTRLPGSTLAQGSYSGIPSLGNPWG